MRAAVHLHQIAHATAPHPTDAMLFHPPGLDHKPMGGQPAPQRLAGNVELVMLPQHVGGMRRSKARILPAIQVQDLLPRDAAAGIGRFAAKPMHQAASPTLLVASPQPPRLTLGFGLPPRCFRHADQPVFHPAELRQPTPFLCIHAKCFHPAGLTQAARG